jgi:hypothetical protein
MHKSMKSISVVRLLTPNYHTLGRYMGDDRSPADIAKQRAVIRESALANFYAAERRAGADPLTANERMGEYAKRLDAMESTGETL